MILPWTVCGVGSCSVRILTPLPERRTDVISRGEVTSSRTEGKASEWWNWDVEKTRQGGFWQVRTQVKFLARSRVVGRNMATKDRWVEVLNIITG
jgi:hypothetical protein